MEMFAQASRLGLKFQGSQGTISVEDLWNLPISHANPNKASLESIGLALHQQIESQKGSGTIFAASSLTKAQARERKILQLKFDIVKFIGETLLREQAARDKAAETRAKNNRIMELIEQKKEKELEGKSIEELRGLLEGQAADSVEEDDFLNA